MRDKDLKDEDVILNLKEIRVYNLDSFSSSSCSGNVSFEIDCETNHGYCEDPDFTGKIDVLKVSKNKDGTYNLKVKFFKEKDE